MKVCLQPDMLRCSENSQNDDARKQMSMSDYTYFRASFMLRNTHIQITLHLDPIPWPHNLRREPCQVTCGDAFPKLNLKRKKCAILHKCHHEIYFVNCIIKPFILWYGHVSKERVRDSNFPTWPVTPKEGSFLGFLAFWGSQRENYKCPKPCKFWLNS